MRLNAIRAGWNMASDVFARLVDAGAMPPHTSALLVDDYLRHVEPVLRALSLGRVPRKGPHHWHLSPATPEEKSVQDTYIGRCACEWTGPTRSTKVQAVKDVDLHCRETGHIQGVM